MEALKTARSRLRRYPELIAECSAEGAAYAACVIKQENVTINSCAAEFQNFKNCAISAAKRLKTKL